MCSFRSRLAFFHPYPVKLLFVCSIFLSVFVMKIKMLYLKCMLKQCCIVQTVFFRYCLLADLASCLLTFDSESLVPCFLEKVMPMVMNHAEAETIFEDPKVQLFISVFPNCLDTGVFSYPISTHTYGPILPALFPFVPRY